MILWTIQPADVHAALQERKTLHVDPALWSDTDSIWEDPYRWMMEQMARRVPGYQGRHPWWAWHTYIIDCARPDLRSLRHWCRGPSVMLTLDVPDQEVLLSNFDAWHAVLNGTPITDTEAAYDALVQAIWERRKKGLPMEEEIERHLRQSWEHIFDLDGLKEHWMWPTFSVQACFETLRLTDVKRVQFFEGVAKRP